MPFAPASDVLSSYRVLDLTRVRSGPTCVKQLADWGADVIKIEQPSDDPTDKRGLTGRRDGSDFQNLHRNKRAMTLNLKSGAGREVFLKLAARADVVVENYRPDVKDRLGIDYASLKAINPGIVLASISGFGQDGPYATRPGFDQIAQGMGGLMSITGAPGQGPMRVGIPVADMCAGHFAAQGVLLALLKRERTGVGDWIQTSLLQAQVFMLDFQATRWLMDGEVPGQAGNDHPTTIPTGVFETADGHINIACAGDPIWERLRDALGDPRLLDERFAGGEGRSTHRHDLNALINETTRTRTGADWIAVLNDAGVPCGEINDIRQVFENPQVAHLGMARDVDSQERGPTQILGQPIIMAGAESRISRPPPTLGQHTDEVLGEIGLSADQIAGLRAEGAI